MLMFLFGVFVGAVIVHPFIRGFMREWRRRNAGR